MPTAIEEANPDRGIAIGGEANIDPVDPWRDPERQVGVVRCCEDPIGQNDLWLIRLYLPF